MWGRGCRVAAAAASRTKAPQSIVWQCSRSLREVLSDECEPVSNTPTPPQSQAAKKAAPLCESGGAGQFVDVAVLQMALRRKMVVDRGMDGREYLQCSQAPETQHRPLSSSEWQVGICSGCQACRMIGRVPAKVVKIAMTIFAPIAKA